MAEGIIWRVFAVFFFLASLSNHENDSNVLVCAVRGPQASLILLDDCVAGWMTLCRTKIGGVMIYFTGSKIGAKPKIPSS